MTPLATRARLRARRFTSAPTPARPATLRRHRRLRSAVAVAATIAGAALAQAAPALAADAPVRTIARDTAGLATPNFQPMAVGNDGREVLATLDGNLVVRDVAAGTTKLLVAAVGGYPIAAYQATPDLRFVLLRSTSGLVPADTDYGDDFYLLDRSTGKLSWVTRDLTATMSDGQTATNYGLYDPQLSGDGRFVTLRLNLWRYATQATPEITENTYYRYDRTTDQIAKVRTMPESAWYADVVHRDAAGAVLVTNAAAYVGKRAIVFPLPKLASGDAATATVAVSSDGSAIAVVNSKDKSKLSLITTATGAITTVTVPAGLVSNGYDLVNVQNGGGAAVIRDRIKVSAGNRQRLGLIARDGTVTQTGGDVPADTSAGWSLVPSDNGAFGANAAYLAQLGSTPLPGAEPAQASQALSVYMSYEDTHCAYTAYSVNNYRATVTLIAQPRGVDPRTPKSATVKVFKTGSPSTIYNQFSVNAGVRRELTVPQTGGWTYAATVTFTDGSTMTGSVDVPTHQKYPCDPFYYF